MDEISSQNRGGVDSVVWVEVVLVSCGADPRELTIYGLNEVARLESSFERNLQSSGTSRASSNRHRFNSVKRLTKSSKGLLGLAAPLHWLRGLLFREVQRQQGLGSVAFVVRRAEVRIESAGGLFCNIRVY